MKMGDEYKYKYNPHHHYSFQQRRTTTTTSTSTFLLPMLCRLSIKDVKLKRSKDGSNNEPSSSSPKVSCIGQAKRRNSKIHVGIPTPHKPTKLKRFFSGKNLIINTTRDGENSCGDELLRRNNTRRVKSCSDDLGVLNVSELDPPLPVVKKVGGGGEVSLWSRRSGGGGASFKTLHLHLPNNSNPIIIPPTTV